MNTSDQGDETPIDAYTDAFEHQGANVVNLQPRAKRKKSGAVAAGSAVAFNFPEVSASGPRKMSPANWAAFAHAYGWTFRHNAMALSYEVETVPGDWHAMDDATGNEMWLQIVRAGIDMNYTFWESCAKQAAHRNRFDPFRKWRDLLPIWDGNDRIGTLFARHGGAEDSSLNRAMVIAHFVGAIRRGLNPGCKHDGILTIEGEQGTAKSTTIRALSPFDDWVGDSIEAGEDAQRTIEQTRGKWLIELAELAGHQKRESERIKAWITRRFDRARLPWDRATSEIGRRWVLFATVNADLDGRFLSDPTGNRRYWCIRICRTIDTDAIRAERDQLWAEAAYREADGEPNWLLPEMEKIAAGMQARRVIVDPWDDVMAAKITDGTAVVRFSEAWSHLQMDPSKQTPAARTRLRNAMYRLGYMTESRWCPAISRTERQFVLPGFASQATEAENG